jgi:putative spermidine/putrescine transport system ATP-binding protein
VTAIELRHVVKRFGGGVTALRDLNLAVEDGEFLAFLGPSGCGKTTTLRLVAGFEAPTSGEVVLGGRRMAGVPPEKRDVGIVFQNYALFPHMTVQGNVEFGLEMRKVGRSERRRRVGEILERLQLHGLAGRRPAELSGGQQQRTALARALVMNPRVLLLDEPLANLDRRLRDEMQIYIRDLQRELGITTIHVTHDQSEALTMAQRVAVMSDGQVQQLGTPDDVYWRPANSEVARVMGLTNLLDGVVTRVDGHDCVVDTPLGPISSRHAGGLSPRDPATVMVRPEQITFNDGAVRADGEQSGGRTLWPAKVVSSAFLGPTTHDLVRTDTGRDLAVLAIAQRGAARAEHGVISIAPGAGWALPTGGRGSVGEGERQRAGGRGPVGEGERQRAGGRGRA